MQNTPVLIILKNAKKLKLWCKKWTFLLFCLQFLRIFKRDKIGIFYVTLVFHSRFTLENWLKIFQGTLKGEKQLFGTKHQMLQIMKNQKQLPILIIQYLSKGKKFKIGPSQVSFFFGGGALNSGHIISQYPVHLYKFQKS